MGEVTLLPGITRADLEVTIDSDAVLQGAIDAGVTDAIVIGVARDGSYYLAYSDGNRDAVVGKLFAAATKLAG